MQEYQKQTSLEDLENRLDQICANTEALDEIRFSSDYIREYLERNPQPLIIQKTEKMPAWRFVFSWIMIVIVALILVNYIA